MPKLYTWLAVFLAFSSCEAYKILVIFPVPARSHEILGDGVVRHLLNAGHEVTYIEAFPKKNRHANLTEIVAKSNYKTFNENTINLKSILDKKTDFKDFEFTLQLFYDLSTSTVNDENVQKLLRDPNQHFDVIIAEWMLTEVYSTIASLYQCPFIWLSSIEPHWVVLKLIDEAPSPAYTTDYMTSYLPPFSFQQRVHQLWNLVTHGIIKNRNIKKEKVVYQNSIVPILRERGKPVPEYEDLMYNSSLILGNSHVSLGSAPKLPQSYIPIGGYHIEENVKPLPEDLKKILDNAKHGLIYLSLGSNLKSKDIPQNLKDGFLKMFSGLKQTVLWKFEEVLPNLPKNVHIVTWAPQQSILAHPNCILFITHGGLLSTTEAIHFGKPIIGIPVFGDQFGNVDKAVYKGFAQRVDLTYTMDKELKVAIDEVLGNPKYAHRAKQWSLIYHDRPVTPGQELVHWVEHVVKVGGAEHLRSPALMVPWYQKMYLDLLAVVFTALIVLQILLGRLMSLNKSYEKTKLQ